MHGEVFQNNSLLSAMVKLFSWRRTSVGGVEIWKPALDFTMTALWRNTGVIEAIVFEKSHWKNLYF